MSALDVLNSDLASAAQVVGVMRETAPDLVPLMERAIKQPYEDAAAALEAQLAEREIAVNELRAWVTNGAKTLRLLGDMAAEKFMGEAAETTRLIETIKGNKKINGNGAQGAGEAK